MEEKSLNSSTSKSSGVINSHMYRLYFKGLVSQDNTSESLAGFGVAICDQEDNLLFQMKEPIHCPGIAVLEAELMALAQGLASAVDMGINHLSIYCDDQHIYDLVSGILAPEPYNIALLMADVLLVRQHLTSSNPVLVTRNEIKFANELAMQTIVSEIRIHVDPLPQAMFVTCSICLEDNIRADTMFCEALCLHEYCVKCVKQHIEARLLEGSIPYCLYYQCKSELPISSCASLITPELKAVWQQRLAEGTVPLDDRVYCPNPNCSALMSQRSLSRFTEGVEICCYKCKEPFCLSCRVPWHNNLSCDDYKKLGPDPNAVDTKLQALANQKMWRQCGKCQHMVELKDGCIHVTCRCGYSFCYTCGEEWTEEGCTHQQVFNEEIERIQHLCRVWGSFCALFLISVLVAALVIIFCRVVI